MNQAKLVNMVSKFWHPYSDPWGRKCAIGQLEINRILAERWK